ncbi:hypothetical protein K7X08_000536 [Anisodus acutangulus]|uniref:Uncharacterized protein n=1 Tax=Anisodus acutangulus TaxID=402998 RepID=A0A9Q1M3Y3_9SOLA|nr:hypothetical protein K7X08_000536 [Anisodus acutangulus]
MSHLPRAGMSSDGVEEILDQKLDGTCNLEQILHFPGSLCFVTDLAIFTSRRNLYPLKSFFECLTRNLSI